MSDYGLPRLGQQMHYVVKRWWDDGAPYIAHESATVAKLHDDGTVDLTVRNPWGRFHYTNVTIDNDTKASGTCHAPESEA